MGIISVVLLLSGLVAFSTGQQFNYADVIQRSLLFYEAQRTGVLPAANRIPWRGNTFVTDRGINGEDLSGGYFDAGDHVKFGFPGAAAMAMLFTFYSFRRFVQFFLIFPILAWGMYDFRPGYERSEQWANAIAALRWGTDYMIKIHPSPNVLYVQVGNGREDHSFWGRPEQWTGSNPRPVLRATTALPASEVAAETAAAMAAAGMVFRDIGEAQYAATLSRHGSELYTFATTYRGGYHVSFPEVEEFYRSWSGFGDEFLWAAAWLYRATGEPRYRTDYNRWWTEFNLSTRPTEASWDLKQAQAQALLAKIDGSAQFVNAARDFCNWSVNEVPRTPLGLSWFSMWGSLSHTSNVAQTCLVAAQAGINTAVYRAWATSQINYMLGSSGRSFVVGFAVSPPQRPHHTSSSCPNMPAPRTWDNFHSPAPNPQILHGALVGGPDINYHHVDDRSDYISNEVTIDYNAGFQSALAEMVFLHQ